MSYHDIGTLSRSGIGLGSLLSLPLPPLPTPARSIQPLRPTTGPDNERVITPRWPTAVLLGRAAFLGGDYYSFYSLARSRGCFFAPAPITIPLTRPLYCLPPPTHPRGTRCPMRVAYKDRIVSFSILLPLLSLSFSRNFFLSFYFTFSAFLWHQVFISSWKYL